MQPRTAAAVVLRARPGRAAAGRPGGEATVVIDLDDVDAAAARLKGVALNTPVLELGDSAAEGREPAAHRVLQVPRRLQRDRPAARRCAAWSPRHRATTRRPSRSRRSCTACPPPSSCRTTRRRSSAPATVALGAEIIDYDRYAEDREALLSSYAAERGSRAGAPVRGPARAWPARGRRRSSCSPTIRTSTC